MPKISVIVPIYNVEKYLQRCVDSILNQTFSDYEVILVDDGSSDNSGKICDEYLKKDSRVVVIHQENNGPGGARNTGLKWSFENSDSEWISFVDGDDWLHPNCLEFLLKGVKKHNAEIASSPALKVSDDKKDYPNYSFECTRMKSKDVLLSFSKRMEDIGVCSKLFHKELFRHIEFPVNKLWEDMATTYKLFVNSNHCAVIDSVLYYYFINYEGTVRKKWNPKRMDEFEAYDNMFECFKCNAEYHDLFVAYQKPYILEISYSYYMCINSDMSKREINHYSRIISARMRKALREFRKTTNFSFKEYKGVYETAYPILMNIYYILDRIKNIIRKG